MKIILKAFSILLVFMTIACQQEQRNSEISSSQHAENEDHHEVSGDLEDHELFLSSDKFNSLSIELGDLPSRNLSDHVTANGWLEVSPQGRATVTSLVGANVRSIKVEEGDRVQKGDVLGYLSHPDLIQLQSDYIKAYHELAFLEQEYQRQNRLFEEQVSSGKNFEQTKANYLSSKGVLAGLESQLQLLGFNIGQIQGGKVYQEIAIISPIQGYVEHVNAKIGQFAPPEQELFEIVNTASIHADLLVFEKDAQKVKKGQTVEFALGASPDSLMKGTIYAVGASFEKKTKAVQIHAKINNVNNIRLLPGMYVSGRINVSGHQVSALPKEAVISNTDGEYIFVAQNPEEEGGEWKLQPLKVNTGREDDGWVEINLIKPLPENQKVVWNQAYYLIAEMKKGETAHEH